ncbi:MAG: 2-oxoglutarate oxidoreductase [Synergistaceae bacterium]|jgi:2-oxoglutarate ferredoxin oxidoreductase subunit beta|nr:2-oxoglutarate oxidoreductase [Synergistaceae bacterium]
METVFQKTALLSDAQFHYCPGCTHGVIHRLVAESIEELGLADRTIAVAPVGCALYCYDYFELDIIVAAHGRAPAVATGAKRAEPGKILFTYQGDGDLASIGCSEINYAAIRGEKITTIFVNNAIYGMTGGQMSPTTLPGQKATTAPYGRDVETAGWPIRVCEMLATHEGSYYLERVALDTTANIRKAKSAIKKAFQYQAENKGFNLVEVLSTCPTNWGLSPSESMSFVREQMIPYFQLGTFKDKGAKGHV